MKLRTWLLALLTVWLAASPALADTLTTNLGLTKPGVGSDDSTWGALVNTDYDLIDAEYNRTTVGDANYTVLSADRYVALTTTLTAPRTLTLPAASSRKTGQAVVVLDEAGAVSATNTLTITAAGTDTINGAATYVVSSARQVLVLRSDGTSNWTVLGGSSANGVVSTTTWTPQITFTTPGNLAVTYSTQTGTAVQITNGSAGLCYVAFTIITSALTFSTASGNFNITGLPYAAISNNSFYRAVQGGFGEWSGFRSLSSGPTMNFPQGQTSTLQVQYGVNQSATATIANFTSGTNVTLKGSATYRC